MAVGTLLLFILIGFLVVVGAIALGPLLRDLAGSARLRKELAAEKQQKRIAYRALREILSSNGDGASLIAEIAVNQIDSNEIKELN